MFENSKNNLTMNMPANLINIHCICSLRSICCTLFIDLHLTTGHRCFLERKIHYVSHIAQM